MNIFNKQLIYNTLFINVKNVLEVKSYNDLTENMMILWDDIHHNHYNDGVVSNEQSYNEHAINHFEFTKIIAITIGDVAIKDGEMKRNIKKITTTDEISLLNQFIDYFNQMTGDNMIMCGFNIINHSIPLLIKRMIINRNRLYNKSIPVFFKSYINSKPWESNILDIKNIWNFKSHGKQAESIVEILESMNLKKSIDIFYNNKSLNDYYHLYVNENENNTLKTISTQSANELNITIQFLNEMRQL